MYRIGGWKFSIAALTPLNAMLMARSPKALGAFRFILFSFQALIIVWMLGMAAVAVAALVMRRKVDIRTPVVDVANFGSTATKGTEDGET